MSGPYGDAWEIYRHAGWLGVVPLPPRKKTHPPKGTTGEAGVWPSYADCMAWSEGPEAAGNVALRLPHNVIGIDVDAYDGKPGAATFADAIGRWGALPPTWESSSRTDGVSRIKFFRVPEGLAWPGELGPATELIQYRHRYAVVWPSIHPDTGSTYRWITPEGVTSTAVPDPDALPLLPDAWVEGLTGGERSSETPRNALSGPQTQAWVVTRPGATDAPCARMRRAIETSVTELATRGSAHNAARDGALRAVRLADEGHAGLAEALAEVHRAFVSNATSAHRAGRVRGDKEAEEEWGNLVVSAIGMVSASASAIAMCDCAGGLTGLIVGGAYPTAGSAALTPLPVHEVAPEAAADEAEDKPSPEADGRERTSWWPKSLAAVLAGEEEEPPPAHLTRADGGRLFYDGKVNGLLGESESGKTWIALLAVVQALTAGNRVSYLDFEDTRQGIVSRLRALGAPTDLILTHLDYISPDEILHAAASDDLREHLDHTSPALIVLDGVNAAMTILGLDLNSNTDATKFAQLLLRPLSASDACVVVVDHLPKNKENRGKGGIGAQAKRAMMTGCAITVDVLDPFGRGMTGRLKLTVDKDRPGHVRALCPDAKSLGTAILRSDSSTGSVTVSIEKSDRDQQPEKDRGRRSMLMEAICEYLASTPSRTSLRGIRDGVHSATQAGNEAIDEALGQLVRHGHVERQSAGSGFRHTLTRPFTVAEDLSESDRARSVPNRAGGTVGTGRRESVPRDVSPKGHGTVTLTEAQGSGAAESNDRARHTHDTEIVEIDGRVINTRTGEILEDAGGSP